MAATEDVRGRRLQPVYHALESGNWRQAVRLCEMRDVEKWLTTKALKANGLWRMGKYDEGLRLCMEVQAATPTDEDTLAAMSYNYRMMNRMEHVAPMFEAAVKAKPGDGPLLKELFMSYVRAKEYLKAQQVATKLHKVDSRGGKFIIWAAATMLIQAERKDRTAGPMTLPLAEKMAFKVLEEKAANEWRPVGEELRLYLDVLKLQGKHREALEALERFERSSSAEEASDQGKRGTIEDESSLEDGTIVHMQELERLEIQFELYARLGGDDDIRKAEEIVKKLLKHSPDQWSYYVSLLDVIQKGNGLKDEPQEGSAPGHGGEWPAALTEALMLIRKLQEENPTWRGPFLAEMELLKRAISWFGSDCAVPKEGNGASSATPVDGMDKAEDDGVLSGLLRSCIARYMQAFSAKLCCFADMRPCLALFVTHAQTDGAPKVRSAGMHESLNMLKKFFRREACESAVEEQLYLTAKDKPLDQEQRVQGVKRLHRYICACQSRHLLGDYTPSSPGHDSTDGDEQPQRAVVKELTAQYRATLHLNLGSEGGQREVQHGDELVILAARTLLRLCESHDRDKQEAKAYLGRVEVACLLEAAIACSPYNHHLKILAVDVYRQLGSFARGLTLFGQLDVKQIQVDTLSYLIIGPSHGHGLFGEVQGQCKTIAAVHRHCKTETAEHVARAFDRGNYSKGAEVDRFQRQRLDLSLQLALARAMKVTIDIVLDHQTFTSAARYVQEEALSDGVGVTVFPGDEWLEALEDNMDYAVQADRCVVRGIGEEEAETEERRRYVKAGLKRRLLANETFTLALKGAPASAVDAKARELEEAVHAAASPRASGEPADDSDALAASMKTLSMGDNTDSSVASAGKGRNNLLPWQLLAAASRALAFTARGVATGGTNASGQEDAQALKDAVGAMVAGAQLAKAYRAGLSAERRHACVLDAGESGSKTSYQAEAPLRPEWLRMVSKLLADGGVFTCILLQAIGAELPLDKKKKSGKGKGKGKGKKAAPSSSAAAGSAAASEGGASGAVLRAQEALSSFGWEVAELFRAISPALKSEISAKLEPARPGEIMARLLKGELGPGYEPAMTLLWEETAGDWCEGGMMTITKAVVGVTKGQGVCCQRLHSLLSETLSTLQRWEKKS